VGPRRQGGDRKLLQCSRLVLSFDCSAWNLHLLLVSTGVFRVLGSTAVAFSSLVSRILSFGFKLNWSISQAIAVYTFIGVCFKPIKSMRITLIVAIAFWALDALIVILGFALHRDKGEQSYMAPAPVSTVCCITQLTHMANLSVSTGVRQTGNICSGRRLGNIFGCGSPYSLLSCFTFHYGCGREATSN